MVFLIGCWTHLRKAPDEFRQVCLIREGEREMENMAWSGIPLEAGLAKLPQGHQLSSVIHYTRLGRYHRAISSHQSFTTQGWEGTTGPSALISHSLHKAGKVPQGHQLYGSSGNAF